MTRPEIPIAVLISGTGSNLQALVDTASRGDLGCAISVVISDRPGVYGLERASAAGIPTEVVSWSEYSSREEFTASICSVAEQFGARGLVLAGFMRILSPEAIRRFPEAIINVHPALLPAFPGADAIQLALDYGAKVTGVTVHFVDEQVDHGPIIAQEAVAIEASDDRESLHARIRDVEHRLLPEVVAAFARGEFTVKGRKVIWDENRSNTPMEEATP